MGGIRLISSPILKGSTSHHSSSQSSEHKPQFTEETFSHGQVDLPSSGLPQLVRHEESTTIELFYDLFFVANLTTFTSVHEVNSTKTLTSYIGFFCVLWFTWCLTSLYDVRFMADSWLERLAKACHLGVMVGLSIVGPNYNSESEKKDNTKTVRVLALILMASRVVLAIQYSITALHLRKYKNTKLPVLLHMASNIVAAIVYLILALALNRFTRAHRAFYVIAVAEMVCIITVSSFWKVCSFKDTHLVERMSLLTLYILGEGVIDILKSTGKLAKVNDKAWSGSTIGVIIAAISTVYLLYMLYFDCLNHKYFGSIRQQIWSFAHFPFHAVLVLSVTGMAQFVVWHQVVEAITPLSYDFASIWSEFLHFASLNSTLPTDEGFASVYLKLELLVDKTLKTYPSLYTITEEAINGSRDAVGLGFQVDDVWSIGNFSYAFNNTLLYLSTSIFETYGFEAQKIDKESPEAGEEFQAAVLSLATVFVYMFIAAGLTIIILGALSLIMDTHKSWRKGTILRFISHFFVGIGLALVAVLMYYEKTAFNVLISPWLIPIYTFATVLVLAFHHIKWGKRDKEHDIDEYAAPQHVQHLQHAQN